MRGWSETRKTLSGAFNKSFGFVNSQQAIPTGGKTAEIALILSAIFDIPFPERRGILWEMLRRVPDCVLAWP